MFVQKFGFINVYLPSTNESLTQKNQCIAGSKVYGYAVIKTIEGQDERTRKQGRRDKKARKWIARKGLTI
jgi:hypothetical protein